MKTIIQVRIVVRTERETHSVLLQCPALFYFVTWVVVDTRICFYNAVLSCQYIFLKNYLKDEKESCPQIFQIKQATLRICNPRKVIKVVRIHLFSTLLCLQRHPCLSGKPSAATPHE